MNLVPLFEEQRKFRERINYNESDKFDKLVLALLVEIGECANEWRGFKIWSKDQEPRLKVIVKDPLGQCEGYTRYPLLEEYVDGLAFVMEIGLEHGFDDWIEVLEIDLLKCRNITNQFIELFETAWDVYEEGDGAYYHQGLELYLGLGEMLGFSWEQIEQAYFEKMKINHQRQENGY